MKEQFYFENEGNKEKAKEIRAIRIEGVQGGVFLEKEYKVFDEMCKNIPSEKGGIRKFLEAHPSFKKRLLSFMLTSSFLISPLSVRGEEQEGEPEENTKIAYIQKEKISDKVSEVIKEAGIMVGEGKEENYSGIIEKTNNEVGSYIKKLGMFEKLGLVKNIKKNAEGIRDFANTGDEAVFENANGNLRFILERYRGAFDIIKGKDEASYKEAIDELLDIVETIEISSVSELKKDKRFG